MEDNEQAKSQSAKDIVVAFIDALNKEDYPAAAMYLDEHMKFEGVLGTRDGADTYIHDMKGMKLKYDIKKTFEDGDDVCLIYNIAMAGMQVYSVGWYVLEQGRIKNIKVVFDPRQVLEFGKK